MNSASNRIADPAAWRIGTSFHAAKPVELKDVKRAGMDCIELTWFSLDLFDPQTKKRLDAIVREAWELGIEVWSAHIPFGTEWDPSSADGQIREAVVRKVSDILVILKEWGIGTAVFHPSWEPVSPDERDLRLELGKSTLGVLGNKAAELGVRLAVECLPRTCLGNRADEIEYLVASNPGLGVCCDVNHLFHERPQHFIERLGSRIVTTHMSDNDGVDEKHWPPGDGVIEWCEVISALAGTGYRGPFIYEVRTQQPDALMANWTKLLKGFRQ